MKRSGNLFRGSIWPLAAAGVLLAAGCDSDKAPAGPGTDDPLQQSEDINDPYGGFNRSSEPAAFGDVLLTAEGEVSVNDEIASEPGTSVLLDRPETTLYAVRVTWGYLERDSTNGNGATDWTGSAVADTGAVIAVRAIAFEQPQGDHIVRPRESRERLDWVSTTTVSFDGLQLLVVDPLIEGFTNTLTIEMPLFQRTYDVVSLASLSELVDVDDAGHQVRVQARKVDLTADCRAGWASGRWGSIEGHDTDLPDGVLGRFRAHWVDTRGTAGGTMRGFYGINDRGHRVLFGKIIDRQGNFVGLLRGTWDTGLLLNVGTFRAHWLNFDREVVGGMRGVWEHRGRNVGGFLHGAWATSCDDQEGGEVVIDPNIF
jgi:hypothetical protein